MKRFARLVTNLGVTPIATDGDIFRAMRESVESLATHDFPQAFEVSPDVYRDMDVQAIREAESGLVHFVLEPFPSEEPVPGFLGLPLRLCDA